MSSHAHGLSHDLRQLAPCAGRRRALAWLAGVGGLPLLGCGGGDDGDAGATSTASTVAGTSSGSCALIPEETSGPYPGDGSNSGATGIVNALAMTGIVRSDLRSSFSGATGTAAGVPLVVNLRVVDTNRACADLSGYAVYLWHCDREGRYSLYSNGITGENYLRGVQATDASGEVSFSTIFPGCYDGRVPHIHFEVYRSTSSATSAVNKLRTSQLAFPDSVCDAVYATAGYSASAANHARIAFSTDNVFRDGVSLQLAEVSGSASVGYIAALTVGIAV